MKLNQSVQVKTKPVRTSGPAPREGEKPSQVLRYALALGALLCGVVESQALPAFYRQPANFSVSLGAGVTNMAAASGTAPMSYQWFKDGQELAGCTSTRLVLLDIQATNAGAYQVLATDPEGTTWSDPGVLTVDPTFTKITKGVVVQDYEQSAACAWGDVNGDGRPDLFITNMKSRNVLYLNNGDGTFRRDTNGPFAKEVVDTINPSHGAIMVDFHNSGRLDIFVCNIGRTNFFYRNLGAGQFEKIATGDAVRFRDRSIGPSAADFNLDGWLDLFVATGGIPLEEFDRLYRNTGDGNFVLMPSGPPGDYFASLQGVWADYNLDGYPDLFVAHFRSQTNTLYLNNQDGTFQRASRIPREEDDSVGAAWGDYNNDGLPDLVVTRWHQDRKPALNALYRNVGNGRFEKVTTGPIATDQGGFIGCLWFDFDNDGFLDLFLAGDRQRRLLYRNNGNGTFTRLTEGSLVNDVTAAVGCAVADYNGDGFPDLCVANGALSGPECNSLYLNNGNSNAWLKVRLTGTLSNCSAIGAKVRVKAVIGGVERRQIREISSGSGCVSQNDLEVIVGLGDAQVIDTIRIEWPSGVVQEFHDEPVRQTLEITEPIWLHPDVKTAAQNVELKFLRGCTTRPLLVEASSDLAHWDSLGTVVPESNLIHVVDPAATTSPSRCYRARVP